MGPSIGSAGGETFFAGAKRRVGPGLNALSSLFTVATNCDPCRVTCAIEPPQGAIQVAAPDAVRACQYRLQVASFRSVSPLPKYRVFQLRAGVGRKSRERCVQRDCRKEPWWKALAAM